MMFAPSIAVLGVHIYRRRSGCSTSFRVLAQQSGLTLGKDRHLTIRLAIFGWLIPPILVALTATLAATAGVLKLDIDAFSLLRQRLGYGLSEPLPMAAEHLLLMVVAQSITVSALFTMLFAFGEEWGWRGWMLPRLVSRWGAATALMLSGVIWGLWHFPLTLLGYNYPELGAWAAVLFVGACVLLAIPIGWLRLVSGSIWPAVAAHGALNASAGLIEFVGDVAEPPAMHIVGIGGLAGWVVLAALSLVCPGHLRTQRITLEATEVSEARPTAR